MKPYKYVLIKPLPDFFKIEVNEEQSEALQEELFKAGKKWADGTTEIHNRNIRYLFVDKESLISYLRDGYYYLFEIDKRIKIHFNNYFKKQII